MIDALMLLWTALTSLFRSRGPAADSADSSLIAPSEHASLVTIEFDTTRDGEGKNGIEVIGFPFQRCAAMDLFLSQKPIPDGTRRAVRLVSPDTAPDIEIFFDLIGEVSPEPRFLDGFVVGVIFHAMRVGQPLRVHGPTTKEALCNLSEFQDAWVRWRPHLYRKIEIIPSAIVTPEITGDRQVISAFSGGVDSGRRRRDQQYF